MIVKPVLRLWLLQLGVVVVIATLLWWFNHTVAYSVLFGGLIYIVPNVYFALYAFRYRGARSASLMVNGFYRGEKGKFLLSCIGFAVVFTWVNPLNPAALFITYLSLTVLQWVVLSKVV